MALTFAAGVGLVALLAACGGSGSPASTSAASAGTATHDAARSSAAPSAEPLLSDTVSGTSDAGSAVGRLVTGFPTDLLPIPPDAVILVTSAEPVGTTDVREVSLNLHTQLSTSAVLDLYRASLTKAGFTQISDPGTALTAQASFSRSSGDELVSIGILDDGTSRTVTIGGRVRVAPAP